MAHKHSPRNAHGWAAGLFVHDAGMSGVTFEHTDAFSEACSRFNKVAVAFHGLRAKWTASNRPALFALHLIVESQVLNFSSLKLAVGDGARCFLWNEVVWVEWIDPEGWRDRRALSPNAINLLSDAAVPVLAPTDWRWVRAWLRDCCVEYGGGDALTCFILDAVAWWSHQLTPAQLAHCCGVRRRDLMPAEFLARSETGLPQISNCDAPDDDIGDLAAHLAPRQTPGGYTRVRSLVQYAGEVARDREAKETGRVKILDRINAFLPLAAAESRNSVLILGASRHALVAGGIRGKLWAPVTFYEYLRVTVDPLLERLGDAPLDRLDGVAFHAVYEAVLAQVEATQRDKCSAFLQVFHRFLVLVGAEPLPALLSGGPQLPPHAADFTPVEIAKALEYIDHHANTVKVGLQARLIVELGYEVPLRTYEFWCIRIGDVDPLAAAWVVICPRRSDGQGKVAGVRRTENVPSLKVRSVMLDLLQLRRHVEDAADDDLLLGEALAPNVRHEVARTEQLVNAALRWASGVRSASIYDLRHACFQRWAKDQGV